MKLQAVDILLVTGKLRIKKDSTGVGGVGVARLFGEQTEKNGWKFGAELARDWDKTVTISASELLTTSIVRAGIIIIRKPCGAGIRALFARGRLVAPQVPESEGSGRVGRWIGP